jgi:NAD(P)-dependent dehydrogenase (short-subunit alcohol dehydrogenase family)
MHSPKLNIVVVGGSSGIGRAIVTRFAAAGHRVFATYFSNTSNANEIKTKFCNVEYCFLDQGELESVEQFSIHVCQWLSTIKSEDGSSNHRIDVLINNAALGSATVVKYIESKLGREMPDSESMATDHHHQEVDTPEQTMRKTMIRLRQRALEDDALMRVNALGPLWVTESLLPLMRCPVLESQRDFQSSPTKSNPTTRSYSTIIFMGSVGGGYGVFPEYRASDLMSKAAVTYLSKHLAAENVHSNIDIFCLSPGATNTEMFRKSTLEAVVDPTTFTSQMPKKRLIHPEELADSVFTLSTEKWARIFHGGVLDASLGLAVRPGLQTESSVERFEPNPTY